MSPRLYAHPVLRSVPSQMPHFERPNGRVHRWLHFLSGRSLTHRSHWPVDSEHITRALKGMNSSKERAPPLNATSKAMSQADLGQDFLKPAFNQFDIAVNDLRALFPHYRLLVPPCF